MEKRTPSRPTTPLRPSSRTSLRESQTFAHGGSTSSAFPLESLEPAFAELADSMADLEANFMHLQLMHESLSRFNENFASFLYGLNMNAFCVDFPEAPIAESFKRARQADEGLATSVSAGSDRARPEQETSAEQDNEATFLCDLGHFVLRQTRISQEAAKIFSIYFFGVTAKLGAQQTRREYCEWYKRSSWEYQRHKSKWYCSG
ncbi:MAG: hypothetical protein LQ346_000303 [Caloplaca aetnensis]|nr:MAG: hypothetical protein LQ346_000303 [Caloplaca aetnensis]